ncbi:hypothetical protein [Micromonospora sp. CPCC 205561]|uniref:hypothetical protein n=1 Tax=Micromonospora sp. CPCC 205561 TaxID=3122407 RepID=UPI002FEE76C8
MTTRIPTPRSSTATLDYYLLHAGADDGRAAGLLVEEFVLDDDLCAVGLRSAGWTAAERDWWSSAAFARAVRTQPGLRARTTAVDRRAAEAAYRGLGGGTLPDEETLRGHFRDDAPLAPRAPLRLGAGPGVHRILFAGEPDDHRIARLSARLRLTGAPPPDAVPPGAVATGRLRVNDTELRWDLRRVGGIAWCIDVTSAPAGGDALRWLLRQLVGVARGHGLVPATVERLG